MTATDAQVRILLFQRSEGRSQAQAAAKANLRSRKTVAKYEGSGLLPSQMKVSRSYRTRPDPFADAWPQVRDMLEASPTLEAKTVFEWLRSEHPGQYELSQLRTFQRRVSDWRALNQEQVLTLEQVRQPGRCMQTDGIDLGQLGVTVQGQPLRHWLIHTVLPYSNWEWGVIAQSESLIAITRAFQAAVVKLQHVPAEHQVDNTTAATHKLRRRSEDDRVAESGRGYNEGYLAMLAHFAVEPRTTHLNCPDENGDVEGLNGALLRAFEQELLLRGSRDFESIEEHERWCQSIMDKRDKGRTRRLQEELAAMRPLSAASWPERREYRLRVSRMGTVQVLNNSYSVPSGLRGRRVTVYAYEWYLEVLFGGRLVQRMARQIGKGRALINYRHVIGTLLRKPGGFRGYRYQDQMFPTPTFRAAWEDLDKRLSARRADITYLRVLNLAAQGIEADVELALEIVLSERAAWDDETVQALVGVATLPVPAVDCGVVDLTAYDRLLTPVTAHVLD